jgi:hypothetical protein
VLRLQLGVIGVQEKDLQVTLQVFFHIPRNPDTSKITT